MTVRRIYLLTLVALLAWSYSPLCLAQQTWNLKRTYETQPLISSPFFLFAVGDLNENGKKELVVADFGKYGDHVEEWKQWKKNQFQYNLGIVEWEKNELKLKFQKQWDTSKAKSDMGAHEIFMAYEARQMTHWNIGKQNIVETIPPYLGIEWQKGKYVLREQQGWAQNAPLVGSWVFPWISPSCYQSFPKKMTWPRECLLGMRDFSGKGTPEIISIFEEEVVKNRQYRQTLRVRKFAPEFSIEWSKETPRELVLMDPIDRLNSQKMGNFLLRVFRTARWYLFEPGGQGVGYRFRELHNEGPRGIVPFDLPDFYLRTTQKKGTDEFWGYRRIELSDPNSVSFIVELRKVSLKPDLSGFVQEDIAFPQHEHYLGVGFFAVEDMDGDGLDEIILAEQTAGRLKFTGESIHYGEIRDYIHILRWDGSKYQDVWTSPPFDKRGVKFLVEDIKKTGKKQLVVLSPYGTVQIWERQ